MDRIGISCIVSISRLMIPQDMSDFREVTWLQGLSYNLEVLGSRLGIKRGHLVARFALQPRGTRFET